MSDALEWVLSTILSYPVTATVLLIASVAGVVGWVIVRDIRMAQDDAAEAAARRINATHAEFRRQLARQKRDAIAYTGKEQS